MYDRSTQVGRFGFEVQMVLLVHPEAVVFDPTQQKLGTALRTVPDLPPGPDAWRWTADPCALRHYAPAGEAVREDRSAWFVRDHHRRFRDALGYQTYWIWAREDVVALQLELVSDPFDSTYTTGGFRKDLQVLYGEQLAHLLDAGIVAAYREGRQQRVKEQLSIEIDNQAFPWHRDAMEKLRWLSLGVYLLTTFRSQIHAPDAHTNRLLDMLVEDTTKNLRRPTYYDLFTNERLLLDGYFFGPTRRLDFATLRRMVTSRIHTVLLASNFDNDRCYFLVHGDAELTPEDLAQLHPDDLALYRHLGIDTLFADMLAGRPQPHLDPQGSARRLDFHREALRPFLDLDTIEDTLQHVLDGKPAPRGINVPLCHPRKTLVPGVTYLEMRHIHHLRSNTDDRYKARYRAVPRVNGDPVKVIYPDYLHTLANDLSHLFDIALVAGSGLARAIDTGEHGIAERDFDTFFGVFAPQVDYLLRSYQRPPWRYEEVSGNS